MSTRKQLSVVGVAILVVFSMGIGAALHSQWLEHRTRQAIIGQWVSESASPGAAWTVEFCSAGLCRFNNVVPTEPFEWSVHDRDFWLGNTCYPIRDLSSDRFVYGDGPHPIVLLRSGPR